MFCDLSNKERREKKLNRQKFCELQTCSSSFPSSILLEKGKKTRESDGGPLSHR